MSCSKSAMGARGRSRTPPRAEPHNYYLFIGNPGTGKSTLINGVLGKPVFKARPSFDGTGVTFELDTQEVPGKGVFMDTPGLADNAKKEQAAEAITNALKYDGFYRIYFVMTEEAGRIRPADKATMKLILEAAPISDYSIIVNKCHPQWINHMSTVKDDMDKWRTLLMHDLPTVTGNIHFMAKNDQLEYKLDVQYQAPEDSILFIRNAPGMMIHSKDVKKVKADELQALEEKHTADIEKLQNDARALHHEMSLQQARHQEAMARADAAKKEAEDKAEQARKNAQDRWDAGRAIGAIFSFGLSEAFRG